jgi:hypothetical protein
LPTTVRPFCGSESRRSAYLMFANDLIARINSDMFRRAAIASFV